MVVNRFRRSVDEFLLETHCEVTINQRCILRALEFSVKPTCVAPWAEEQAANATKLLDETMLTEAKMLKRPSPPQQLRLSITDRSSRVHGRVTGQDYQSKPKGKKKTAPVNDLAISPVDTSANVPTSPFDNHLNPLGSSPVMAGPPPNFTLWVGDVPSSTTQSPDHDD
ncbi:hypothetical protein LTR36_004836 [Oleoguttula mirabilis]|uniref:Uncharacterized protein n=1 Tax=Oleoguttula mirabilis TaxID=1507867 RepID=A0AAV9JFK2_9PEZI|nr:hypothetical protein LTR36_004836 [Oleoguttula mirabilis]